jgi:glycosyltransferase involved in cell wall biosynthesis
MQNKPEFMSETQPDKWPPKPVGKKGWPWEASSAAPVLDSSAGKLPTISVVVVSYNQAAYLEEALRSLLLQQYPHLEIFVADGASRDGSVEIIRRYEPWLAGWFSEPDRGQSDALNKGFKRVNGEIWNWLCSDDLVPPGALRQVGEFFRDHPSVDVLAGGCHYQYDGTPEKSHDGVINASIFAALPARNPVFQPSCYFRRHVLQTAGPIREDFHFAMDWEIWCRFLKVGARWAFTDRTLGIYRVTGENKSFTGGNRILGEMEQIYREYSGELVSLTFWFRHVWLPLMRYWRRDPKSFAGRAAVITARYFLRALQWFYSPARCEDLRSQYWVYGIEQEEARRAAGQ